MRFQSKSLRYIDQMNPHPPRSIVLHLKQAALRPGNEIQAVMFSHLLMNDLFEQQVSNTARQYGSPSVLVLHDAELRPAKL